MASITRDRGQKTTDLKTAATDYNNDPSLNSWEFKQINSSTGYTKKQMHITGA